MTFKGSFTAIPGLNPTPPGLDYPMHPVTRNGDDSDNDLKGGFSNDSLFGNGGKDRLEGLWGDDVLYGGADRDELFGGSGDDKLFGNDDGIDPDGLFGGIGNDEIHAGSRDIALGEAGDDTIYLSGRQSDALGGIGKDTIIRDIDGGHSRLYGGEDDDLLIAFGRGALDIENSGDVNSLYGGDGEDTLVMIGGYAEAFGGEGDDTFIFGAIEDGGFFIANDSEGANEYHVSNNSHEELRLWIDSFDGDDSLHLYDFLGDGVTTLDSNGDGFITRDDDHVTIGTQLSVRIELDGLSLRVQNADWTTSDQNWLTADQVEIA